MEKNGTLASPATARASKVFPCSRHSYEKDSLGNLSTETLEFPGIFEIFHNLHQFIFGLIDTSDVTEGHLLFLLRVDFRPALPKRHDARLRSHSRKEKPPYKKEEDEGRIQEMILVTHLLSIFRYI